MTLQEEIEKLRECIDEIKREFIKASPWLQKLINKTNKRREEMKKFKAWAVDLEYADGEKVTAYWDFTAGVHWWNDCSVPRDGIREFCVPNQSYKNERVKSYSDVYVVEITRTPVVKEIVMIEKLT